MIEFNAQVDASIATGQLAVTSAQRLADAQARGGDIAMARARSENVLAEQLARGVDPMKALTLAALDYQKSLADLSAQQRAWNRDIAEQIDGARRLAQAETESGAAVAEANIQNKIRAQILKEVLISIPPAHRPSKPDPRARSAECSRACEFFHTPGQSGSRAGPRRVRHARHEQRGAGALRCHHARPTGSAVLRGLGAGAAGNP
uniref:hypothetical protein n=1 Tax=Azospirillum argentinense TaxID=2970906 RepID=UPI0010C0BA3B|nr:hypothetical protein [Azospirillum argentinense]